MNSLVTASSAENKHIWIGSVRKKANVGPKQKSGKVEAEVCWPDARGK